MLTSFLDTLYDWRYKLKEQRDKISGVFKDRIMKTPVADPLVAKGERANDSFYAMLKLKLNGISA